MLEADYLVVGSGAIGMAFADILINETDASIIIVDKHAKPGGHWNVAYPFVTLHQPSNFYGVSSKELSTGRIDEAGLNKGLLGLATGPEISGYFNDVMKHQFLSSGRVQYFPLCTYIGNGQFESMLTGEIHEVKVNKKIVDATFLNTSVPSTHTPNFEIHPEINFMPLNDLPKIKEAPEAFIVIGGGKTGIDACLWLLEYGVNPDNICWIISRDAWLLNRANVQPTEAFFENTIGAQAAQFEAIKRSTSIPDMFDQLEAEGIFLRLDSNVRPQMFHGATITELELEQLRRIKNVIRKGRVTKIEKDKIFFQNGETPTNLNTIHVDCSATPISNIKTKPIFQDNIITPQTVRPYQPLFSAAFIAFIEATWTKESEKNLLCNPVRLPNHDMDWIPMMQGAIENQFVWAQHKKLGKWLYNNRLDGFSKMVKDAPKEDAGKQAIIKRMRNNTLPAVLKLMEYRKEIDQTQDIELNRPQFQIQKNLFLKGRLVEMPETELEINEGEVVVQIDKFAYTANNITYAVAGDMLGYWKFFPLQGDKNKNWGVIPVWGFADVIKSNAAELPVGERIFGYFPPAKYLKMTPTHITGNQFVEGSAHRSQLPAGYNLYNRVLAEKGYSKEQDNQRALLYPLYLTSYCIWDMLQEATHYEADQILILSASSKTSIGVAYAFQSDPNAPKMIGVTSKGNLDMVRELGLYESTISYDNLSQIDNDKSTVIVDMSGNGGLMAQLHQQLGDKMKHTVFVGYTHWMNAQQRKGINESRTTRFFVPMHAQQRIKEWGYGEFSKRTSNFVFEAGKKSREWLSFRTLTGLKSMDSCHAKVCTGHANPKEGIIIEV
jgi:hypothetical protein